MRKNGSIYRKPRRTFSVDITTPNESINIRTAINRMARGQAVGGTIREHKPMPPDGIDINDFETGTEEILDIVDAVNYRDSVLEKQKKSVERDKQESSQAPQQQTQAPQQQTQAPQQQTQAPQQQTQAPQQQS